MKFAYFTDMHARTKTPTRRTGSFENDVVGKLAFMLITAQEREVDAIVCGGDLFDLPNPSFRLAAQVMNLITSTGIPWFHVLGNHDVIGHNPESYTSGVFAFFEQLPNFEIMRPLQSDRFIIRPLHFRHGVEEMQKHWQVDSENDIIIAHAMVTPRPVPFTHVTPTNLKTNARIVLLGHYHDPWATMVAHESVEQSVRKQIGEGLAELLTSTEERTLVIPDSILSRVTLFLNPGSVARISLLAHNLRRTPRMLIIDTAEPIKITSIPIAVARPSAETFKIDEARLEKNWESRISEFIESMENVKIEGLEISTMIVNAAKARAGVDTIDDLSDEHREVMDNALDHVARVEELRG